MEKTAEEYNPTVDFRGTGDHYLHPPPETIVCLANLVQVIIKGRGTKRSDIPYNGGGGTYASGTKRRY